MLLGKTLNRVLCPKRSRSIKIDEFLQIQTREIQIQIMIFFIFVNIVTKLFKIFIALGTNVVSMTYI